MKSSVCIFLLCFCLHVVADPAAEIQTVLLPFQDATISARVDSVLLRNRFKIGEKFRKGDVLLELDSQKYAVILERSKGKLKFSETDLKDKRELQAKHISSEWELKKSEFDYAMAKADFDEALLNFSCCMITAPFNGKIAELLTKEYETVRNGQPLCRIIADHQLLAVMNVPIRMKQLTTPGSPVTIRLQDSRKVQGKVYEAAPIADNRTGTVRIRVLIDNSRGEYTAGLTGVLENGRP